MRYIQRYPWGFWFRATDGEILTDVAGLLQVMTDGKDAYWIDSIDKDGKIERIPVVRVDPWELIFPS